MVLVQKWPFFQLFFYTLQTRKMYSMIFQDEKTPFQAIKSRSSKSRKIDIFPKGLTHGFGQIMAIFQLFFFWAIDGRKMSFMIFENEKMPFQAITRSSKSRKNEIFPKGFKPRFLAKTGEFSNYFFLGNIGQEYSFMLFQNKKTRL